MPNQNILYIIPYIILGSFSLILAYRNFAGKTNRDQVWISFLLILGASWAFFQFFEFLSIGIKGKIFWDILSWIPIAFIPALYFLLTQELIDESKQKLKIGAILVEISTFILLLIIYTNGVHHWVWKEINLV